MTFGSKPVPTDVTVSSIDRVLENARYTVHIMDSGGKPPSGEDMAEAARRDQLQVNAAEALLNRVLHPTEAGDGVDVEPVWDADHFAASLELLADELGAGSHELWAILWGSAGDDAALDLLRTVLEYGESTAWLTDDAGFQGTPLKLRDPAPVAGPGHTGAEGRAGASRGTRWWSRG